MPPSALERLQEALLQTGGDSEPVAVGWATVDLDRAALELADLLGLGPDVFVAADDSITLGGRCRIAAEVLPGGLSVVILEPSTEGRLAGRLARLGEGPAAVWSSLGTTAATDTAGSQPGPFGPERLVPDGPPQGPYRIVVTAPGTIAQ